MKAGWKTNGAGSPYSLIDECCIHQCIGKERDIWAVEIGGYTTATIVELLGVSKYDLIIRHLLLNGYKHQDKVSYAHELGVKSIKVNSGMEFRSTSYKIYSK